MPKKFWLFSLLFIHACLGLLVINQSLWLDEAITAIVVRDYSWGGLLIKFLPTDFHPPLYYVLQKIWTNIFGISEFSLRLPSVLFALGAGALVYSMAGFWAAGFLLLNPLFIYYSTEARMYSMATFLIALILFSLKKRWPFGFVVFIILSFNSFYGTAFFLAALGFYLFIRKDWLYLRLTIFSSIVAFLIASPLLLAQLNHSRQMLGQVANWSQVLGTASIKNLLLIPLKFSLGRVNFEPKWLYYAFGLVWTTFVWLNLKWQDKQTVLLIIPVVLAWIFSFLSPLLSYFRFLYLLIVMAILFSAKKQAKVLKTAVLLGFLMWSLVYVINPRFHREDWRSLANSLPNQTKVYGIVSSLEGINYYRPELKRLDVRTAKFKDKQLLVVPYTSEIYGFNYEQVLKTAGYQLKEKKAFHQLVLESWTKLR